MRSIAQVEDRAVGIGLFIRSQGRSRDDALAWMRSEGIDDAIGGAAWERSAERYRALLRRFARRDIIIASSVLGLAIAVAAASSLLHWGFAGFMPSLALLLLVGYAVRNVPSRLRGEPSAADRDFQRVMRERHPHLPPA